MLNLLLEQLKKLFKTNNSTVKLDYKQNEKHNQEKEKSFTEMLDTCCSKFTFYVREDGEFAVTTEFFRSDEEIVEVSSKVLHMLNSGLLAEYFVQSLKLWGDSDEEKRFILEIIKKWKVLYDEDAKTNNKSNKKFKLAVDPSDVFGLKSLKDSVR